MQTPRKVTLSHSIQLSGVKCRTTNKDEMNPSTARIGQLWGQFFQQSTQPIQSKIYSVYTNYESDHNGAYDIYVATPSSESNRNLTETIQIPQENDEEFLVFSGSGKMPETCINLWQSIWQYFDKHHVEYSRAFSLDFEEYDDKENVKIYIALKK